MNLLIWEWAGHCDASEDSLVGVWTLEIIESFEL